MLYQLIKCAISDSFVRSLFFDLDEFSFEYSYTSTIYKLRTLYLSTKYESERNHNYCSEQRVTYR